MSKDEPQIQVCSLQEHDLLFRISYSINNFVQRSVFILGTGKKRPGTGFQNANRERYNSKLPSSTVRKNILYSLGACYCEGKVLSPWLGTSREPGGPTPPNPPRTGCELACN